MKATTLKKCQNIIKSLLLILFVYILFYNLFQYIVPRLFFKIQEGNQGGVPTVSSHNAQLEKLQKKSDEQKSLYEGLLDIYKKQKKTIKSLGREIQQLEIRCAECSKC